MSKDEAIMISPNRTQDENAIPPLRDGDILTVEEFERRWDAMPGLKHAELIEGRVYMNAAALRWDWHAEPYGILMLTIPTYAGHTPGVLFGGEPSVRMGAASMPQPDGVLRVTEEYGGRSRVEKGYVVGGPEFVAEVSGSSEGYDLREKKDLYLSAGVHEYLNWSVLDERIVLFRLERGTYVTVDPSTDGLLKSLAMPGLWFDPAAMLRGDSLRVMEVLHLGLASPEHQAFIQELKDRRAKEGTHD